ncbi:hypothetical protein ABT256_36370, partial [Amycolatopsis japonica]|uniref:hypothetical protein n=1 Tax=Amycolatopsis japonica TaxID=208439 RepID=UPI0033320AEB
PQLLRQLGEEGLGHDSIIPEEIEHVFVILSNQQNAQTTLKSETAADPNHPAKNLTHLVD